jgi:hypothetical protein
MQVALQLVRVEWAVEKLMAAGKPSHRFRVTGPWEWEGRVV